MGYVTSGLSDNKKGVFLLRNTPFFHPTTEPSVYVAVLDKLEV